MIRSITICGKSYDMKASVLTIETYKRLYNKDLFDEIQSLNEKLKNGNYQELVIDCLHLAYIMIKEQTPTFPIYDEWVKDLDGVLDEANWILEVLELGVSPFRRGVLHKQK